MKGRFKQLLIREGDAETREGQSRNNSIALGQGPGSTSRDTQNNIFELFSRTKAPKNGTCYPSFIPEKLIRRPPGGQIKGVQALHTP